MNNGGGGGIIQADHIGTCRKGRARSVWEPPILPTVFKVNLRVSFKGTECPFFGFWAHAPHEVSAQR